MNRSLTPYGLTLCLLLAACGDSGESPGTDDASADVQADGGDAEVGSDATSDSGDDPDTAEDTTPDVDPDTADDTEGDAADDATPDVDPDTADDTTDDTTPDVDEDAADAADADAATDAAVDADVSTDAEPDTTPDAEPDTTPDAAPDAAPDTTPDTAPDTTPDAAPDTTPDTDAGPVDLPAVTNGDFEDGDTGWGLDAGARVVDGIGTRESGALQLEGTTDCESLGASTQIDFAAVEDPKGIAVQFTYQLSSPFPVDVAIDGNVRGQATPSERFTTASVCVGAWQGGEERTLSFRWSGPFDRCEPMATTFVVDDVSVVEDARCQATPAGGFEPDAGPPALLSPFALVTDHPTARVQVVQDPSEARSGDYAVRIDLTGHCGIATVQVFDWIPSTLTGPRPGVRFWARGQLDQTSASATGFGGEGGFGITPIEGSAAWRSYDLCLDGGSTGATVDFGVSLYGTDVCDDATFEEETLWIDDISFVDDATCL